MEHSWNNRNNGKTKYWMNNLSQCPFINHKSHTNWTWFKPRPLQRQIRNYLLLRLKFIWIMYRKFHSYLTNSITIRRLITHLLFGKYSLLIFRTVWTYTTYFACKVQSYKCYSSWQLQLLLDFKWLNAIYIICFSILSAENFTTSYYMSKKELRIGDIMS